MRASAFAVVAALVHVASLGAAAQSLDSQTCINQYSGSIFVDFENVDVEAGSSFQVKIGSINTGNVAWSYAGSSSVIIDQESGDIFLSMENTTISKGAKFGLSIGELNTGNLAVIHQGHDHPKPSKTKAQPSKKYQPTAKGT